MSINRSRLVQDLTGVDVGASGLSRMTISSGPAPDRTEHTYSVLYNPATISVTRSVNWESLAASGGRRGTSRILQRFTEPQPAVLEFELFFDTYESRQSNPMAARAKALAPVTPLDAVLSSHTDVQKHTAEITRLAMIDRELHRPPSCRVQWASMQFDGVLASVSEVMTMFASDGTPVRARLHCRFLEEQTASSSRRKEMHSSDITRQYVVKAGDTLTSIAHEFYGDLDAWRAIATANKRKHQRDVTPGDVIEVPRQ